MPGTSGAARIRPLSIQNESPRLILASASTARQAVLHAAGLVFTAQAARVDEDAIKRAAQAEGASADDAALQLAEMKAQRVARRETDALVIGADQILLCGERWFDKPADLGAVRTHLLALRGQTHTLVTAMVCFRDGRRIWHHIAHPRLTMRNFSDRFLDAYVAAEGAAAMASVGAYRLEGLGVHLFDRIEGEHSAILGLPLLPLLGFLRQHGVVTD
jgi:septum formation protein